MPKVTLCKPQYQEADRRLTAEISRGMLSKGHKPHEARVYTGLSRSTWYSRAGDPGRFTLAELRALFDGLHTSDRVILEIFGREADV